MQRKVLKERGGGIDLLKENQKFAFEKVML